MSKDKAEEKARAYAGITPDVNNVDQLPNQFVFVKTKYFSFFAGYAQAVTDLSTENAQLREALREMIYTAHNMMNADHLLRRAQLTLDFKKSIEKAKQLLTDNTKEDVKYDKQ